MNLHLCILIDIIGGESLTFWLPLFWNNLFVVYCFSIFNKNLQSKLLFENSGSQNIWRCDLWFKSISLKHFISLSQFWGLYSMYNNNINMSLKINVLFAQNVTRKKFTSHKVDAHSDVYLWILLILSFYRSYNYYIINFSIKGLLNNFKSTQWKLFENELIKINLLQVHISTWHNVIHNLIHWVLWWILRDI